MQKIPPQTRSILLTCIYGLAAGVAAVLFQIAINVLFSATFGRLAHQTPTRFLAGGFCVIVSTSLLVGFLLTTFCSEASGSGIPQLKAAFWKNFGLVSWRVVWVKFLGGVLSIGGGCALGREGPSVQLAGGLASNAASLLGEAKQKRRTAAAAGAAAGLAAAFNTPLAAMTFVLEEMIEDLNSRLLGRVLLASVIGALVVHGIIGAQPAFKLGRVSGSSWEIYLLTPIVAIVASFVGVAFQKSTLALRLGRKKIPLLPAWTRPAIGGVITWAIGSAVFLKTGRLGVFSLGYTDLSSALNDDLGWQLAGIFVLAKLIATVSCYGFGGCGGIFSPLLFLGGMSGYFIAGLSSHFAHLNPDDRIVLAVVGMSSCLGAVVRAPVTGILIVFEMTHEFTIVPALMIAALISQAISLRLCRHGFYDEILVQDGHKLEHVIPPRDLRGWQEVPVSAIANFNPISMTSTEPLHVAEILRTHPYAVFPVLRDEIPIGLLRRREAEMALAQERECKLDAAVFGLATQSIRDLQRLLIESTTGVVLLRKEDGEMLGLVTLHDLLRAQTAAAENSGQS